MTDILDLIDSAVADWTVSGDAMRCGPETAAVEPARPYFGAALAENQARIFAAFAARFVDLTAGMRTLTEQVAAMSGNMRQFSLAWQAGKTPEPGNGHTAQVDRWTGRQHRRRRRS